MATKTEKAMAYAAGQRMMSEPPERRTVDACPFAPGSDEAQEWLRGFQEALGAGSDPAALQKQITDAMKAGDRVG